MLASTGIFSKVQAEVQWEPLNEIGSLKLPGWLARVDPASLLILFFFELWHV